MSFEIAHDPTGTMKVHHGWKNAFFTFGTQYSNRNFA